MINSTYIYNYNLHLLATSTTVPDSTNLIDADGSIVTNTTNNTIELANAPNFRIPNNLAREYKNLKVNLLIWRKLCVVQSFLKRTEYKFKTEGKSSLTLVDLLIFYNSTKATRKKTQHWKVFTDYDQGVFFVYLKFCFVFLDLETTWLVEILVKNRTTYLIFREIVCLLIFFCVPWTVMRWFPRKLVRMSLYGKRIEDLHCFGKVYRVDQIVNGIVPIIMTKHDQRLVNSGR